MPDTVESPAFENIRRIITQVQSTPLCVCVIFCPYIPQQMHRGRMIKFARVITLKGRMALQPSFSYLTSTDLKARSARLAVQRAVHALPANGIKSCIGRACIAMKSAVKLADGRGVTLCGRNGGNKIEQKIYGYIRVSTREQNEDRQVIALREVGVPEKFIDKR